MSKTTIPESAPDFWPGDVVASYLYMGTVINAFWDGTWNYSIGNNASTNGVDMNMGYKIGEKFIRRADIKWRLEGEKWVEV
jgi:hypothetical protein